MLWDPLPSFPPSLPLTVTCILHALFRQDDVPVGAHGAGELRGDRGERTAAPGARGCWRGCKKLVQHLGTEVWCGDGWRAGRKGGWGEVRGVHQLGTEVRRSGWEAGSGREVGGASELVGSFVTANSVRAVTPAHSLYHPSDTTPLHNRNITGLVPQDDIVHDTMTVSLDECPP